ncbi:MAG: 3-methyl-2-oxobutanoate hydroxymethyltransferase [Chloroflexi bacterium]|nr:3-methyl-2-oxobutanoate hydroxymethyltransferase [Chloroflexota bacterium]MCI0885052.1 3-methyl-2-oxobutanoate hydroxymethyltransferase [Chloroflexota bacterium]
MKQRGEKIVMITAYEYSSARLAEEAGIPLILVGDSLGNVVLGYDSTIPVTMDEMVHHVKPVVRATDRTHVVADMPFGSFQGGPEDALRNAARLLKEGGAQSVKLEGGKHVADTVRRLTQAGIPVMGHLGLTPQSINQLGGYKVQGKTPAAAVRILNDAMALQEAGAYAIVLEAVPVRVAEIITDKLDIPTIGIGAGWACDGQVQVWHDLLGLFNDFVPRHAKRYANLGPTIVEALRAYASDVRDGAFPTEKESFVKKPPAQTPTEAETAL